MERDFWDIQAEDEKKVIIDILLDQAGVDPKIAWWEIEELSNGKLELHVIEHICRHSGDPHANWTKVNE